MNQGKLDVVKQARVNIDILGINDLKWTGMGEFNSDDHYSCLQCRRSWVRKIPGVGNGNPLQYSCLENPMDRGAWRATVYGVTRLRHDLATKPRPLYLLLWARIP